MRRVQIVEVGPRDGLQNEAKVLSIEDKLRFIERLAQAGLKRIEAASFVNPKWVPQMADAQKLYPRLPKREGVRYSALVPNARGMEDALSAGAGEVAVFTAASETFSRKNVNMSIQESFAAIAQVVALAKGKHVAVRGYLSTCFGCPYEGRVDAGRVAELAQRLLALGCFEVSVSDTIGAATPGDVDRVLDAVLARVPAEKVALHFHDTRGMALANVLRALEYDVAVFDSAAGGAGGCPFAPGAAGNVATEDLLFMLAGMGVETGVSLDKVAEASRFLESVVGRQLPSRVLHSPAWSPR